MKIEKLIEDYIKQTKICSEIDYASKSSVAKNNKAVDRMYTIVELISRNNNQKDIDLFSALFANEKYRTNLWSSIHALERLAISEKKKKEALKIIKDFAKGDDLDAIGLQYWLKEYTSK